MPQIYLNNTDTEQNDGKNNAPDRITYFLNNASVYRPNKFLVGLYGSYVYNALQKMEAESKVNSKMQRGTDLYYNEFSRWKDIFYHADPNTPTVELKWACVDVTIPHVSSKVDTTNYVDAIKGIKYPLIKGCNDTGKIVMKIREDKNLMWYQFFNAITNQFYTAQVMRPKSSFQKIGIYIAPLQEAFFSENETTEFNTKRSDSIDIAISHVFEFNSAVLTDISPMILSNESKDILEYKVTFDVPNVFQDTFKNTFKGLKDNTSDTSDSSMLKNNSTTYNNDVFEITNLKSATNGYYKE